MSQPADDAPGHDDQHRGHGGAARRARTRGSRGLDPIYFCDALPDPLHTRYGHGVPDRLVSDAVGRTGDSCPVVREALEALALARGEATHNVGEYVRFVATALRRSQRRRNFAGDLRRRTAGAAPKRNGEIAAPKAAFLCAASRRKL